MIAGFLLEAGLIDEVKIVDHDDKVNPQDKVNTKERIMKAYSLYKTTNREFDKYIRKLKINVAVFKGDIKDE